MDTIVFDLETQKSFNDIPNRNNVWDMLMSTCVTYSYNEDSYKFWTYLKKDDLLAYLNGNTLIGFNSINFDLRVLLGENMNVMDDYYSVICEDKKFRCENEDIYLNIYKALSGKTRYSEVMDFMRRNPNNQRGIYSLNSIAIATLGNTIKKNGTGAFAPELYKTKKLLELLQYNLQDVRVTKKLWQFIKQFGYIINGNFDIVKF